MRSIEIDLAGEKLSLAVTWQAAEEITQKVGDILVISREVQTADAFRSMGIKGHEPKFKWTGLNVSEILWIGAKHGGKDVALSHIQELVVENGLEPSRAAADRYLSHFLQPKADELLEAFRSKKKEDGDTPSGE